MNFFDSLFEKIPILRDIDRKKRKMAAIFFVFVIISILGIIIDAIAEAGGAIALTAVAIGFLLMAAMIIADFVMSKKKPKEDPPPNDEPYNFFDDSPGDTSYQDESYDYYNANDGPRDAYGDEMYENDYRGDFRDDGAPFHEEDRPQELEYTVEPELPREDNVPKRFGGVFYRGQSNESTAISDEINGFGHGQRDEYDRDPRDGYGRDPRDNYDPAARFSPELTPEESSRVSSRYAAQPVMNFTNSPILRDEVTMTANAVAPNVAPPPSKPEMIGGPVMSIPVRSGYTPPPAEPVVSQPPAAYTPPVPIQTEYRQEPAYDRQDGRGKEIEEFFDDMSEEELLYSDCVEVWAADAKPAAIRLLKQVESLSDKKMADSLGREAEYINAMLDRIYYFTMLDSIRDNLELKKYNFSAVVKECLRRFSPFFMEKRIGLLWKGLDIDIITDKRWLIFALTQVVFNAVEFTGLGGKIAISAKKEGSLIHLMVDDNGCGISDEDLSHIFMAGFMGDNVPNESGRRTGMGLFITRSVVEKLGGTVTVESTVGKGTRITIILPEKP